MNNYRRWQRNLDIEVDTPNEQGTREFVWNQEHLNDRKNNITNRTLDCHMTVRVSNESVLCQEISDILRSITEMDKEK